VATRTTDYLQAIEHLPAGATLVIPRASWEEYEQLLQDLVDRPGLRVTYGAGMLEIKSPSAEHEEYKDFILRLVQVASEELGLPLETRGSTTWKSPRIRQGLEPDTCFYVAHAMHVIGKRTIDLDVDPPPDIAVEIDVTNESLRKFDMYAELAVPEMWRYDGRTVRFYALDGKHYEDVAESRFFRGLTAASLTDALDRSKRDGQTTALAAFRARLRGDR